MLVVDDEPVDIAVIEESLNTASFRIFVATSFDEGLAVFDAHQDEIELLLTDVSLPGRTGLDLARECVWKKPELKVLFVSGWTGAEFLVYNGIPKSDLHFLPKPFRSSVLVERVKDIFNSTDPIPWLRQRARSGGAVL